MNGSEVRPTKCAKCQRDMVSLNLEIDSAMRTLHSCSYCDLRIWEAAGESVSLEGVLDEIADSTGR